MECPTVVLASVTYLLWGTLYSKHLLKCGFFDPIDKDVKAFFAVFIWPLVHIYRVIFSEK